MSRRIFGPKRNEVTGEWRKLYILRSLMICTLHQIHLGEIQKNDMGKAHSKYGGEERCIRGFGGET
jgi:hypothetical protein